MTVNRHRPTGRRIGAPGTYGPGKHKIIVEVIRQGLRQLDRLAG